MDSDGAHLTEVRKWRDTLRMMRIFSSASRTRSRLVYEVLGDANLMCDNSLYINLGYWEKARNLDQACQDLAEKLGMVAGLSPHDHVLDAGCGFGDQDICWVQRFSPKKITAINIAPPQIKIAQSRVAQTPLSSRIDFAVADATRLTFPSESFDKVLALESAFHFFPREAFLREAFRVLRPGGVMAATDFVRRSSRSGWNFSGWAALQLGTRAWQIPMQNLYGAPVYVDILRQCGYENVELTCISNQVIKPFTEFQRPRFNEPRFRKRFHPLVLAAAKLQIDLGFLEELDYVMVTTRKPGGSKSQSGSQSTSA